MAIEPDGTHQQKVTASFSSYRVRALFARGALYLVLTAGALIVIVPFLYMVSSSLKSLGETITRASANPFSPLFWPTKPEWDNFRSVIAEGGLGRYFFNSVVIAAVTIAGVVVTSCLSAYAFSKLRFTGRDFLFSILIATLMIPDTVLLIPNFLIVSGLGWLDRLPALTVPFMGNAFFIFLLRQFFNQIPDSLVESARIDGSSHARILASIVMPLTRGPLSTVAFLAFNFSWNSLQWPLIVTTTDRWRPIAVGLTKLLAQSGPNTNIRMAGAMVALIPTVVVYLSAQRQITEAVARSGLKG
jgi:multiple sugar transport system permease protein